MAKKNKNEIKDTTSVKRGRGRPPKNISNSGPPANDNKITQQQPGEPPLGIGDTIEIMDIPKISEISPYEGEPQVQSYALPEEQKSQQQNGINPEINNTPPPHTSPHPENNDGVHEPGAEQPLPHSTEDFTETTEDGNKISPFTQGISDDEAKQTYDAIIQQYNFTTSNLLPEIPGLSVKPGKELYQLDEATQQAFLNYIEQFNTDCFGALKINEEDNKMLEEPSIYMIKKQASKITMEDRFKMALAQIGFKKIALFIGIIRQSKGVMAQINERIRQAILERKADLAHMAEMMDSFNARMAEFSEKESRFNSDMEEFKAQKEKWERDKKEVNIPE